jgi:hypothetical protein
MIYGQIVRCGAPQWVTATFTNAAKKRAEIEKGEPDRIGFWQIWRNIRRFQDLSADLKLFQPIPEWIR